MNNKAFVLAVILATFMAFGMISIAFADNYGPKTSQLEIHIFLNPDTENQALETGTGPDAIDINDWPLTKDWIDKWALIPDQVTLRDYVELGMMEVDMYDQAWPTGDPGSKFYDAGRIESTKSVEFRKAVACLVDRDSIVSNVLKGYGFRLDVPVPPVQSDYIDMGNYTDSGVIYNYNPIRADQLLNDSGFTRLGVGLNRRDPLTGVEMEPIKFYIRQDDPNRRRAGEMLVTELQNIGIPVNGIITERTVCYKSVMVLYDFNLYTGGWSLSSIPDQYHDLWASETYYYPLGWSQNIDGFCNHEFDAWAKIVKYPANESEAKVAAKVCGYLFLKYCAMVPMYCSKAVKAYRTGWDGVVNNGGFGIDNYWTFLNAKNPTDDRWDYGFKSDIEQLNQVSSEWLWDQNVLGLMYEGLLGTNPFNLAPTEYWIATEKTVGNWDSSTSTWLVGDETVHGDPDATYINFTVPANRVYFHNVTGGAVIQGRALTLEDINFSFYFQKACGPGIAWGYPSLTTFNKTQTYPLEPTKISVFYNKKSYWAVQWAGGLPILNKDTWGKLWNVANPTWQMDVKRYDPTTADLNTNGVTDIFEDGTGAWVFKSYTKGEWVYLDANQFYYINQTTIEKSLKRMFHEGAGDIDSNTVVNSQDLAYIARAYYADNTTLPWGTGWDQYNPNCDLNGDGTVDLKDLKLVTPNYGKTMG